MKMYDLSLSKNTIQQLMMSIETNLLFFVEKLKTEPQNNEIIELLKQRRRAARELLDAVVEHREDFKLDFGYLSALLSE